MADDFPEGAVWLVGAGPGDVELLTIKAARLIARAEIVFYDALVGAEVLALADDAELVPVGKRSGRHSKDQDDINGLVIAAALDGKRVVRLKGGDPAIFARTAEEVEALAAAGVVTRICPGVTTASAAVAATGSSLSLRGLARRVQFVTAHAQDGEALDLDWDALADARSTLAFYMGRGAARTISERLVAAGMFGATPVMVACDVSLPGEQYLHT
ncbi:MAG: uroporphyrinogen-III C-methyltransferase, partial [Sphingomonas sp.]